MSAFADRLRGVVGTAGSVRQNLASRADAPARPDSSTIADTLGGTWRDGQGHRYLVVDRRYLPGHRHGRLAVADGAPPAGRSWSRLHLLTGRGPMADDAESSRQPDRRLLFFDLETTGLAGGAGTYAFLVGCGWFDGAVFRTRQLFLSSFAAERALLEELAAMAQGTDVLVTFNGKSFDVPLIETRFQLYRLDTPFAGRPHIDMLHHARRLWRASHGGIAGSRFECRLTTLEQSMCGHLREGDVPGFEIPARYFQYVRSGDTGPLEAVFEHNRLDLITLAFVTARAAQLLEEGPSCAETAREALGLGSMYERGGMMAEAGAAYERASGLDGHGAGGTEAAPDVVSTRERPARAGVRRPVRRQGLSGDVRTRAEALRAYAALRRRERRYEEAARAWQRILELRRCPPPIAREASEALAVYHEHRSRDLQAARHFALQSLQFEEGLTRQQAVGHRLARLDRKLGKPPSGRLAMF